MDNATRLQYLEAMGIDVWVPRLQSLAKPMPAAEAVTSENIGSPALNRTQNEQQTPQNEADECPVLLRSDLSAAPVIVSPKVQSSRNNEQAWSDLRAEVAACHSCKLCETRTQTVFGVGNHHADWMLIGEAPGQNEDLQGEPFVGRAGQLLTEMLRAIGLKREQVFIANMLKCRPPNNRDPQAEEIAACHNFLLRQIELVQPKIILAVGRIAAQNLLKTQQPLVKLRGVQHCLENHPLVVVHHPAYLLRSLAEKAKAWDDLQFALSVYQSLKQ
jgi:uracil-DNA glycosylase family 4